MARSTSQTNWLGVALLGGAAGLLYLATKQAGREETFPINEGSVAHVQGLASDYLKLSKGSRAVRALTIMVLEKRGLSIDSPTEQKAVVLHQYVQNLPYTPDPDLMERMQDPERVATQIMAGMTPQGDCDDWSILLAGMARAAGIPASVTFMDTDGDGIIDHAMTVMLVNGQVVHAETTAPDKPLGWKPDTKVEEVLPLSI